ncbi:hypothetical protein QTN25_008242 [Entamoeba marina]
MSQLQHVYLMNVALYFTKEVQVVNFVEVNKKCEEVIKSMKINPLLEEVTFERIKQIFTGMETYQLVYDYDIDDNVKYDGVSIIEYYPERNDNFGIDPRHFQPHIHKIRKLHSCQVNKDFEKIASEFDILRSLNIYAPWSYEGPQSIKTLYCLKNVITLKNLTIFFSTQVRVEEFIELRKLLQNVKISIVCSFYFSDGEIPSKEYVNSLSKLQGINVYFSSFNENMFGKNVVPIDWFESSLETLIKYREQTYNTISLSYPTQISFSNQGEDIEFENDDDDNDDKKNDDKKNEVEEINFSECAMLKEFNISLPKNPSININFPTTLTHLVIKNNENSGITYDSLQNISLLSFNIENEINKTITLPSTLTRLDVENCSNCKFMFNETWNLKDLYSSCFNCVFPLCDTCDNLGISNVDDNTYNTYGDISKLSQLFNKKFQHISINSRYLSIQMLPTATIDILDLTCFDLRIIRLLNINANKLICGNVEHISLLDVNIKEIVFGTIKSLICQRVSSIDIIKGESIETFQIDNSEVKPQFITKEIKNYSTETNYIPELPIEKINIIGITEDVFDLSKYQFIKLNLNSVTIRKVILPTTITLFNINNCIIQCKQKVKYLIQYSNGKLPQINMKQFSVKNVDWDILDARNLNVNTFNIHNCAKLTKILLPTTLTTLVITNCPVLESLNTTTTKIDVISMKDCKLIKELLVNNGTRKIISSCPLLQQ